MMWKEKCVEIPSRASTYPLFYVVRNWVSYLVRMMSTGTATDKNIHVLINLESGFTFDFMHNSREIEVETLHQDCRVELATILYHHPWFMLLKLCIWLWLLKLINNRMILRFALQSITFLRMTHQPNSLKMIFIWWGSSGGREQCFAPISHDLAGLVGIESHELLRKETLLVRCWCLLVP